MINTDSHQINKSFPSIKEFTEMIASYQGANQKLAKSGRFEWENEMEDVAFDYALLGDDAVVWNQKVKINQDQHIHLQPAVNEGIAYIFNFFFNLNKKIQVSEGLEFHEHNLTFCNSRSDYKLVLEKGFEGHILQLIISDHFLRSYVPVSYLKHPYIDRVVNRIDNEVLIIENPPVFVKTALMHIAEFIGKQGAGADNKLNLLRLISDFSELFFIKYLANKDEVFAYRSPKQFKEDVTALFSNHLFGPFPGIEQLAEKFQLSPSTFKRKFQNNFNTTPLEYFRNMQIDFANTALEKGTYPVTQLAVKLGFSSTANFIRAYKKVTGITPGKVGRQN